MISLVELAVQVGGLKVNGLPATNFEHPFVVIIGKELVLFDTGNGMGCMATFARPGRLQPTPIHDATIID